MKRLFGKTFFLYILKLCTYTTQTKKKKKNDIGTSAKYYSLNPE